MFDDLDPHEGAAPTGEQFRSVVGRGRALRRRRRTVQTAGSALLVAGLVAGGITVFDDLGSGEVDVSTADPAPAECPAAADGMESTMFDTSDATSTSSSARKRLSLALVAAAAVVPTAACSPSSSVAASPTSPTTSASSTPSDPDPGFTGKLPSTSSPRVSLPATSSPRVTAPPTAPSTAARRSCTSADVRLAYRGSEGAAGSTYHSFLVTNTSGRSCTASALSATFLDKGAKVPMKTELSSSPGAALEPGGRAHFTVQSPDGGNYDPVQTCGFDHIRFVLGGAGSVTVSVDGDGAGCTPRISAIEAGAGDPPANPAS